MSITIEFKQKNSASFYRFTFEAQEMIENNIVGNHGNVVHFLTCRTYPSDTLMADGNGFGSRPRI